MKLRKGSTKPTVQFSEAELYPLIGNSACIHELRNAIKKYAQCDAEVLIQGETGVGKGLCARLIHQLSSRRSSPFVEVNCGAIPSGLIASELFGHEKGAFTGAISDRIGFIQKEHKGTLFLDEIGDMPSDLQIHLLHFLESKQIHKVGADKFIDVDCRVIAASHVDLKSEVVQGEFREDLFYRLNILPLTIPPLRKRGKDILMLSEHFLTDLSHGQVHNMSEEVKAKLLKHRWPGNVRELRNVIQRAIVMCEDNTLLVADLGLENSERQLLPSVDQIDLDYLLQAIEENKHNMSAAARHLGISRTTLYRLIKKYNINI
ncbi:TPA: sigma-54-dependent Fis family transcriptional regulator [Vibrio parahaemolyticus]|uniref:sigma-54 interaction domain-containing protein n=1 Tax=Vibrio parahaemolyticus TaxID=670 RepID=UPI0015E01525|nr:sigma-54 dependent transcriptional regulator [Vibrio parahaemolyticus]MDF4541980.1 sigma-54 dependent transcriptional regulator [Vibrio parahaemolyticus]MDG2577325.1 sigma-54 dependent transcriptional regulator [Vibrio parahaemolyticus]MDG2795998.1 sigma-54 dependent transcriptional regulator [Vibrio parahaemolyticus]MEA5261687.1 sigma-54 dependent transcriptional regulator [Vibrio parahaemolyticus]MEA5273099.1 sigma-54 dependent transcriptional regulator [Vibrio parahaemolyticus]